MRKRMWIVMALILVIPGLLLTVSCAKKAVKKDVPVVKTTDDAAEKARQAELERQRQLEKQKMEEERLEAERIKKARDNFENAHVYFAYDSSVLDDMAQSTLKSQADWLRKNPASRVLIEGHCDERGTVEYNLALGDRRAESAKRFLMSSGIDGSRLTTVSYGEERPLDPGNDEVSWAKNRRAQFVIE